MPELLQHGEYFQLLPVPGTWLCVDLQTTEYVKTWSLQNALVTARKNRTIESDIVLFCEHPPVFTIGRRGWSSNLTVSTDFLERMGIPLIQVERGGDITYHGPGQLIGYPIVDLGKARLKILDYVNHLEEIMIRAVAEWGIRASRNPLNRGVWVDGKKLASIGIAVRHGISYHGFALNVNTHLRPFEWINPCGLTGIRMTSMAREVSRGIPIEQVHEATKVHMEAIFGVELLTMSPSELEGLLKNPTEHMMRVGDESR